MEQRRIMFKDAALSDVGVLAAMAIEGVPSSVKADEFGVVDHFDDKSSDFPVLRKALQDGGFSYDLYQRRHTDGDHQIWRKVRLGVTTIVENGMVDPDETCPIDIREIAF